MPCSGKTTLADAFANVLRRRGFGIKRLDGDTVRGGLCEGLGFSPEGRQENLRRIAHVARMFNDEGITVLASFVSPTTDLRSMVEGIIGKEQFRLVSVNCPAEVCAERDVKGMWAKAKAGEIRGFTGYDEPFEDPGNAELTIHTDRESETESIEALCSHFGV
jgi:adenylylsulfate kinase